MRIKVIQFNYNHLGGSASIHIEHQVEVSAFDRPSYLGVHCGYHMVAAIPSDLPTNHIVVPVPGFKNAWLNFGVLWSQPVNWPKDLNVPALSEYHHQSARMIANMIATACLDDLSAPIPTLIV